MRTLSRFARTGDDLAASMRHARRGLLPAALTALLVACGGGGGGDGGGTAVAGPPTTGATLTASTNEAALAAEAVVTGADAAVARSASLAGVSAVVGTPIAVHRSPAANRRRAMAVFASPCTDWVDAPCTGSASVDTNVPTTATVLNPGDYIDVRFSAVNGTLLGDSLLLNGRVRLDFLAALDLGGPSLAGLNARLTLDALSGAINAKTFGPITDLSLLQIDSQGKASLTSQGARYSGLGGVTSSGPGSYTAAGATVRKTYWADAARYVDVLLTNWPVTGGRPSAGAISTVAGAQGTVSVSVVSVTANTVVYSVLIATGTGTSSYLVTATYPAGGGAPSYVAVPV